MTKFLNLFDLTERSIQAHNLINFLALDLDSGQTAALNALPNERAKLAYLLAQFPHNRLTAAEATCIEFVKSSLATRFDVVAAFEPFYNPSAWSAIATFSEGALVLYQNQYFVSLEDANLNNVPTATPDWWEPIQRNEQIVSVLLNLVAYELYSAGSPKMIPDVVTERRNESKLWLYDCARGQKSPGLPTKKDENNQTTGGLIRFGGTNDNRVL